MKDPHDIRKAAIEDEIIARSEERESTWPGVCPKCHYATDHCQCERSEELHSVSLSEYVIELRAERDQLRVKCQRLEWDIEAYRGALGYSISGYHTGKLTDGTTPQCGMCNSEYRLGMESRLEEARRLLEETDSPDDVLPSWYEHRDQWLKGQP